MAGLEKPIFFNFEQSGGLDTLMAVNGGGGQESGPVF